MTKEIVMKGLAVGIISLFICLTALPVFTLGQPLITKENNRELLMTETTDTSLVGRGSTISIELTEYRPDGIHETRIVKLPLDMVRELLHIFQNPPDQTEGFILLKRYGLIPEETCLEEWRQGMYNQAKTLGILPGNTHGLFQLSMEAARMRLPFMVSFLSKVEAVYVIGSRARIGLPFYPGILKLLTRFRFMDLIDMSGGLVGVINTKNLIRQHSLVAIPSVMGMGGFVGMHIHIPLILNIYTGFSAITFAAGLGIHTVDFLPWMPTPNIE